MKKSILFATILLACALVTHAQTDTMYVMKAGVVVKKYNIHTQIDSVIFYQPMAKEPVFIGGTFTDDRDGNTYKWVEIGDQVWMAENLKYLPSVVAATTGSQTEPYYYIHGYNGTNVSEAKSMPNYTTYGVLYNWPAAMASSPSSWHAPSGVQGVCPTGWHLPSDDEWKQLSTYLGGTSNAGGKLKEIGTTHWSSPNTGATNETGFTALPGGYRYFGNTFISFHWLALWWSATDTSDRSAFCRKASYNSKELVRDWNQKDNGFSVRCVKD
jgi:uncharacterized protein (TIGR02145 family)